MIPLYNTLNFYLDKIGNSDQRFAYYSKSDTNEIISDKCFGLLVKLSPVIKKYPKLFEGTVLDFASGSGEHTHLLSQFSKHVYTYDAAKPYIILHHELFDSIDNITVLDSEEDGYNLNIDTFFVVGFLALVSDRKRWFNTLTDRFKAKHYIFIVPNGDKPKRTLKPLGNIRWENPQDNDPYTNPFDYNDIISEIAKSNENLQLIDRYFFTPAPEHPKRVALVFENKTL